LDASGARSLRSCVSWSTRFWCKLCKWFGVLGNISAPLTVTCMRCRPSGVYGSSPAVANGVVYITSNSSLYALNASTGALLWSYDTSSGRNYSSTAVSSPTVVDGTAGWQRPESIRERSSLHWDANCRLHLGNRDQGGSSSQAANSRLTKSKGKSKNFSKE
jgi:outer membrane protein assembly factor BamB